MTKPPNKPTQEFGYIAFGKDGAVSKHMRSLSSVKSEQEAELAEHFAQWITRFSGQNHAPELLPEADHDFRLKSHSASIVVQATEVVPKHDYLVSIPYEQWIEGKHGFSETPIYGPSEYYGVDQERRRKVLGQRILAKAGKHYAKTKEPLWLLIWSVDLLFSPFWSEGGQDRCSDSVVCARETIASLSVSPFQEIWFTNPMSRPHRIWPEPDVN